MRFLARRLPWIAAAVFFAVTLTWLHRDKGISRAAFDAYSVHNTSPEGLSLCYTYLRSIPTAGKTSTLSRPLERAAIPADAVLFRIRPDSPVPPGLRKPKRAG